MVRMAETSLTKPCEICEICSRPSRPSSERRTWLGFGIGFRVKG